MLSVSEAFLEAIKAPVRRWVTRVTCTFLDNSMLGAYVTASAGQSEAIFSVDHAADGRLECQKQWAVARDDCLADGTFYPPDDGWETGWMSDELSDGSAELSPAEEIQLLYATAQRLDEVRLFFDSWLGHWVDFTLYYWDLNALAWTQIVAVAGNADLQYAYPLPAQVTTTALKAEIAKISRASDHPHCVSFQGGLVEDLSTSVLSWDRAMERHYDKEGSIPLGNLAAGELNLELDNTGNRFCPENESGPYYGYLKLNRRIEVELGLQLADLSYEYVDVGTYYVSKWDVSSGSPVAKVMARDRAKLMQTKRLEDQVYQGYTISELVEAVCAAAGIDQADYQIDPTTYEVPYAVMADNTCWEHLRQLAIGEGGCAYLREDGKLLFENRAHLAANAVVVGYLDDTDNIVSLDHSVDEGLIQNSIRVTSKRLAPAAETTIWNLQETINVPGTGSWWDAHYSYYKQMTIAAAAGAGNDVAIGDCLKLELTGDDAQALFGQCQTDGDDFRVLYNGGGGFVELDRYLEYFTGTKIVAYFRAQAPIGAGASDDDYWIYYGYDLANNPPADGTLIFDVYDNFDRVAIGADWNTNEGNPLATYDILNNHARQMDEDSAGGNFMWNTLLAPGDYWDVRVRCWMSAAQNRDGDRYGPCGNTVNNSPTLYGAFVVQMDPGEWQWLIVTPAGFTGGPLIHDTDYRDETFRTIRLTRSGTTFTAYEGDVLQVTRLGDAWAPTYVGCGGVEAKLSNQFDEFWVRFRKAVDPTLTLADASERPIGLEGATTVTIEVRFQGAAVDVEAPVLVVAGPDISVVSYSYTSTGGLVTLTNTGPDETVTGMTIDGKLLENAGELVATAEDGPSMAEFGERALALENAFIQDLAEAQALADDLLETYLDPGRQIIISMPSRAMPHLQLADRIHVENEVTSIDGDYWMVRSRLQFDGGVSGELTCIGATSVRTPALVFLDEDNSQYLGVI